MSWGAHSYGQRSYGGSPGITQPTQFPRLFTSQQPVYDLQIQSPWITFYDVTLDDTTTDYFVDFGDIEADDYAGAGEVTFDSQDYTTVKIQKTAVEESLDGSIPEITLTIADPLRVVLNWVLDNDGLTSATVRMRMISYANIDSPSLAIERNFVVNRVISSEGPAAVTFILKAPDFSAMKFPRIFFGRHRCHNDWEHRHTHDHKNYCNYPSDEFELPTIQRLKQASDTATAVDFGWTVVNGTKCSAAPTAALGGTPPPAGSWYERGLWVYDHSGETAQWDGSTRTGFYVYKTLTYPVSTTNIIDVEVKLRLLDTYGDSICGILVQNVNDATDWFFWGKQIATSTERALRRRTVNSSSSDSTYSTTDSVFRLTVDKSGGCWGYTKDVDLEDYNTSDPDSGWTTRFSNYLWGDYDQDHRVGFVCCPDATGSVTFDGWCYYFRFFEGGDYQTCDRTLTACQNRIQSHHYNGYSQLPDGIIPY